MFRQTCHSRFERALRQGRAVGTEEDYAARPGRQRSIHRPKHSGAEIASSLGPNVVRAGSQNMTKIFRPFVRRHNELQTESI